MLLCCNSHVHKSFPGGKKMEKQLKNDLLSNLREEYDDYTFLCECAIRNLMARLTNLQKEMQRSNDGYNIIDSVEWRIKSFESTFEKLGRRQLPMTIESIRNELHDIAGVRITTPFRDDITKVVEMLKQQHSIEVVEEKDYVSNPKENGYMSYHLIVNMTFHLSGSEHTVPMEIQIRDMSMDLWASIEHIINYKNKNRSLETVQKFKHLAEILDSLDSSAIELRNSSNIGPATNFVGLDSGDSNEW